MSVIEGKPGVVQNGDDVYTQFDQLEQALDTELFELLALDDQTTSGGDSTRNEVKSYSYTEIIQPATHAHNNGGDEQNLSINGISNQRSSLSMRMSELGRAVPTAESSPQQQQQKKTKHNSAGRGRGRNARRRRGNERGKADEKVSTGAVGSRLNEEMQDTKQPGGDRAESSLQKHTIAQRGRGLGEGIENPETGAGAGGDGQTPNATGHGENESQSSLQQPNARRRRRRGRRKGTEKAENGAGGNNHFDDSIQDAEESGEDKRKSSLQQYAQRGQKTSNPFDHKKNAHDRVKEENGNHRPRSDYRKNQRGRGRGRGYGRGGTQRRRAQRGPNDSSSYLSSEQNDTEGTNGSQSQTPTPGRKYQLSERQRQQIQSSLNAARHNFLSG